MKAEQLIFDFFSIVFKLNIYEYSTTHLFIYSFEIGTVDFYAFPFFLLN